MILRSLNGVTADKKMDVFEGCDQNQWHGGLQYTVVLNMCVLDEMTAKGWYRGLGSTWSAGDTEGQGLWALPAHIQNPECQL